jgi:transcription elongation factor Elf1
MSQDRNVRSPKNLSRKKSRTTLTYPVNREHKGRTLNHPHKGKIVVVALFCNCGRSVFVDVEDADQHAVICGRCDSSFQWQQLSFADLNAA